MKSAASRMCAVVMEETDVDFLQGDVTWSCAHSAEHVVSIDQGYVVSSRAKGTCTVSTRSVAGKGELSAEESSTIRASEK